MCGIIVANTSLNNKSLDHRGPDFTCSLARDGWIFDHFRLSIRDLTQESNQPYVKADYDEVLIYNGEIYNCDDLINAYLHDIELKTSSDTEVLYELLVNYGVEILRAIDGMFAFAFYNGRDLILARDRMGIKPLYVCEFNSTLIFASEISVILDNIPVEVNDELIPEFIKYKYVGPQSTIYKGVRRLEPGTYEVFSHDGAVLKSKFWNPFGFQSESTYSKEEKSELEDIIKNSIASQLVSDVPVGLQLSGGIDSTIIREIVPDSVESYSSIFEKDYSHDERRYIEECSKRNRSKINWVTFGESYFRDNILNLFRHSGGVNHPHTLAIQQIASEASKKVKVLLSGEGADELFVGYERYAKVVNETEIISNAEFYSDIELESYFKMSGDDVISAKRSREEFNQQTRDHKLMNRLRLLEIRFHLQNLLERYDIASMSHSIEGRVPFMSNEIIDYCLTKDASSFVQDGILKSPLKDILIENYNSDYVYRTKIGYRVPVNEWLFSPWFFEMVRESLDNSLVIRYLKPEVLTRIKDRKISDRNLLGKLYWTILNLASL